MINYRESGTSPQLTVTERFPILETIPDNRRPKTVLLIPDGNGRWAKEHDLPTVEGHKKGAEVIANLLNFFVELPGTDSFILWGFSHDNWAREEGEVDGIMQVMETALLANQEFFDRYQVRFIRLGREDKIKTKYPRLWETFCELEERTKDYRFKTFALAADYSGLDQAVRTAQEIVDLQLSKGTIVTPTMLEKLQDGRGEVPPADLVIRTSGEQRTSDLGWLGRNAEFWTTPKFLPDMTAEDCVEALVDFSKRERRLGGRPQFQTIE